MAKIRTYTGIDPYTDSWIVVNHFFYQCVYEPGAYHTIYAYTIWDLPPATDAWQLEPNPAHGLIAAKDWASRPAMINDICKACRYWDYGANLPRWNIYRGEERPKFIPGFHEYPARMIPCFFMPWWDPPPPGYGQPP